jgi:excisionase family DNA binding protein
MATGIGVFAGAAGDLARLPPARHPLRTRWNQGRTFTRLSSTRGLLEQTIDRLRTEDPREYLVRLAEVLGARRPTFERLDEGVRFVALEHDLVCRVVDHRATVASRSAKVHRISLVANRSKRNHLRLLRLLLRYSQAKATNVMATSTSTSQRVLSASPEEQPELAKVVDLLAHLDTAAERKTRLVGPDGEGIVLPASAFEALRAVVSGMAQGMAMTLIRSGRELTTQEAADLLRISRPSVIRLLEDGTIPFHKVGTHRRIDVEDVLAYRAKRNEQRRAALRELTEISEEIGYR